MVTSDDDGSGGKTYGSYIAIVGTKATSWQRIQAQTPQARAQSLQEATKVIKSEVMGIVPSVASTPQLQRVAAALGPGRRAFSPEPSMFRNAGGASSIEVLMSGRHSADIFTSASHKVVHSSVSMEARRQINNTPFTPTGKQTYLANLKASSSHTHREAIISQPTPSVPSDLNINNNVTPLKHGKYS